MIKNFLYRRKGLLLLLQVFDSRVSKIDFQKYLFLWTIKQDNSMYDFVPYKYGCFSFQSYQDLGLLKKLGYIDETQKSWVLKKRLDKNALKNDDLNLLIDIKTQYKSIKGDKLLSLIYSKYPYYAINSEVAQDVLTNRQMALIDSQRPKTRGKALFTIGYEGRTIESYMNFLIKNNVNVLCDVRKNPLSRKYGFSKKQLGNICGKFNIEYINIQNLGINSKLRLNLNSINDYQCLFNSYKKTVLKTEQESINYIIHLLDTKKRVALTCFEKDPKMCHRNCVSESIYKKIDKKIKITDL